MLPLILCAGEALPSSSGISLDITSLGITGCYFNDLRPPSWTLLVSSIALVSTGVTFGSKLVEGFNSRSSC